MPSETFSDPLLPLENNPPTLHKLFARSSSIPTIQATLSLFDAHLFAFEPPLPPSNLPYLIHFYSTKNSASSIQSLIGFPHNNPNHHWLSDFLSSLPPQPPKSKVPF